MQKEKGGYYITEDQISNLEGKLLTFIEAMGLEKSQESAAKSIVRQEVWELVPNESYIWVEESDLSEANVVRKGPGAPFINRESKV